MTLIFHRYGYAVSNSQYAVSGSQYAISGSQYAISSSRYAISSLQYRRELLHNLEANAKMKLHDWTLAEKMAKEILVDFGVK